jgi:phage antirepressor YoqD-like protein
MNDLLPFEEKRMTVQEVAKALGVAHDSVIRAVRELYPELVRNGFTTYLGEAEVTAVKILLEGHHNLRSTAQLQNIHTDLEMKQKAAEVIGWLTSETARMSAELALAAPKVACAEALMRCDQNMSITDACKHVGLHPRAEAYPYLRAHGYLTAKDLPTQAAIDAGYLELKETILNDGTMRPQAVVAVWQLENWRAHVVHQVKRWVRATALGN